MNICKPHYFRRTYQRQRTISCLVCLLPLLFIIYLIMKSHFHFMDAGSIQLEKCPACFGIWENVCLAFQSGELKVRGNYFWRSESVKGVWYGIWNEFHVVVKTLGHKNELDLLDVEICQNATGGTESHCDVQKTVWRSFLNPPNTFKSSVMQFMECPANHFATLLERKLHNDMGVVHHYQKVMALTNLYFNQEFLFLQIFSERFPQFLPKIFGSCGRVVVVEYVGPSLSTALSYAWLERVKLSLQLIRLSHEFTRTVDNLALYMYDATMDNFAVDHHGNVKLIDCEHIGIVDMKSFNNTYVIKSEDSCSANKPECLTFVPDDLCKGQAQDHNYYAVCRNLLVGIGRPGLLHSPPAGLVNATLLNYLQQNCVYSKQISREDAIRELERELHRYLIESR